MDSKSWYLSKLVWLGIIQTLIGALTVISEFIKSGNPFNELAIILIVTGVLEVVLRVWFTNTPVS